MNRERGGIMKIKEKIQTKLKILKELEKEYLEKKQNAKDKYERENFYQLVRLMQIKIDVLEDILKEESND